MCIRDSSLGGSLYAAHFMEPITGMTEVVSLRKKSDVANAVLAHINIVETHFSASQYRVKALRCDRAKENYPEEVRSLKLERGIQIHFSPSYAPESNGTAERLVQENWTRARILLHISEFLFQLWAEALHHANWLRNRTPNSRISADIPLLLWDKNPRIDLKSLLNFGQARYAFIYYPKTQPEKKLLPRSEFSRFVGMDSDVHLARVYVPATNTVRTVRVADFHLLKGNRLPNISSFLDGLARQQEFEVNKQIFNEEDVEDSLVKCMINIHHEHHSHILNFLENRDARNFQ